MFTRANTPAFSVAIIRKPPKSNEVLRFSDIPQRAGHLRNQRPPAQVPKVPKVPKAADLSRVWGDEDEVTLKRGCGGGSPRETVANVYEQHPSGGAGAV